MLCQTAATTKLCFAYRATLPALRLAEIASACREQVSAELTCHLQIPLFDSISEAWFEGGAQ